MAVSLRHAVLGIDPGGTTGVAGGYVELKPTRKETLQTMDNLKTAEVQGAWDEQARELAKIMQNFIFTANVEGQVPLPNIHVAWEDFVLRRRTEGGATGNLISVWVMAGAMGAFNSCGDGEAPFNENITYRQASQAKNLATDERLKAWGLWIPGSPHKRDAVRHLVLRVDEVLQRSAV